MMKGIAHSFLSVRQVRRKPGLTSRTVYHWCYLRADKSARLSKNHTSAAAGSVVICATGVDRIAPGTGRN